MWTNCLSAIFVALAARGTLGLDQHTAELVGYALMAHFVTVHLAVYITAKTGWVP